MSGRIGALHALICAAALATMADVSAADGDQDAPILLLSTQLTPPNEAQAMREQILGDFDLAVQFEPNDNRKVFGLLAAKRAESATQPIVLAGLHGDLVGLDDQGLLADLRPLIGDKAAAIDPSLMGLAEQDGRLRYAPWMQATYAFVARYDALDLLPKGADVDRLTYDELAEWAEALAIAAGRPKFGLPAGRGGLLPRMIQGYMYPSYTGGMATSVQSPEAHDGWRVLRRLWAAASPRSITFSSMAEPLATGEVWLAWDHIARLQPALEAAPDDYVVIPAPLGPKGRGYFAVVAGLAMPKTAIRREASLRLIDYLLDPKTQAITMASVGFLPSLRGPEAGGAPGNSFQTAMARQQALEEEPIPAVLPVGLGERARDFTAAYAAAFSQIVLRNREISSVLTRQAIVIDEILTAANVACWPPDPITETPCRVRAVD